MSDYSKDNKRIAKNTLFLYFRMMLTMVVSLYTSRVVLSTLGIEDYGVYNVVGGTVAMFSIVTMSLSTAISRFVTFELGKGDLLKLNRIFSTSVNIQILMSAVIVLLGEIIGLWFINYKMNVDPSRVFAATIVLQFSLINFVLNLVNVPFNAVIVAHEHMNAFAYISILEVILKLGAVFLLDAFSFDKLILWAVLLSAIALIIRLVYAVYCRKHFCQETQYHFNVDRSLLKEMLGFASWNFIGDVASVLRTQGVNILLNLFFGPVVNAARGVAVQVSTAISGFSSNFITAVRPQITKNYAQNQVDRAYGLTLACSRMSFFLLFIISFPLITEVEFVLNLWLKNVPSHASVFVILTLILTMTETLSRPFVTLQRATGKVRNYQLVVGSLHLLNFPISLFALKMGTSPDCVYYVAISLAAIGLFARVVMVKRNVAISFKKFLTDDLALVVLCVSIVVLLAKVFYACTELNSILNIAIELIVVSLVVILFGLKKNERNMIFSKIMVKLKK